MFFKQNSNAFYQQTKTLQHKLKGLGVLIGANLKSINETISAQVSASESAKHASLELKRATDENLLKTNDIETTVGEASSSLKESIESANNLEQSFQGMEEINKLTSNTLGDVKKNLESLLTSFNDVVSKTAIINDIVFQTKLLSFNASVEAARAGEHGKGFSVVAEEIGNLAKVSGESAEAINKTLSETNKKVQHIIESINANSTSLSSNIEKQTSEMNKSFVTFKDGFDKISKKIQSIVSELSGLNRNSKQQQMSVLNLNETISNIDETIQKNTLVASETNMLADLSSKEIESLEKLLSSEMEKSRIKEDTTLETVTWQKGLEIGIEEIDQEHKMLVEKLNELIMAMNKHDVKAMGDLYLKVYTIAKAHFEHEEKDLYENGYAGYQSHKQIHDFLLSTLLTFKDSVADGSVNKPFLVHFIINALVTHIFGSDVKYAEFLKSKGSY